jgi:hypothetical protein
MKLNEFQQTSLSNGDNVKLIEYQTKAQATAIYPSPLIYPSLGLCGEIGELIQAVTEDSGQQEKEAGDVLWYIANTAADAGLSLDEVAGRKTFPGEPKGDWKLSVVLCDLSIQAGVVAEHVKKTVRDDAGVLCDKRRAGIRLALKKIIFSLTCICEYEMTTLEECAKKNIAKLLSRQERGKLTGDGDDR